MNKALMFSRATDEWATPLDFFERLDAEFHFGLDAAATYDNRKCCRYLSDALSVDWVSAAAGQPVFLNPPYSKVRQFMAKAWAESLRGCTVVCLVPARTDTRWWHDYVWDAERHRLRDGVTVDFVKGRLKFGGASAGAPFPSVVITFRPVVTERRIGAVAPLFAAEAIR